LEVVVLHSRTLIRTLTAELAGERFIFAASATRQVLVPEQLAPVPLAARELLGLASVTGAIVPVVDVRPLLGLGTQPQLAAWAVLLEVDGHRFALVVDRVLGFDSYDPEFLDAVPSSVSAQLRPWLLGQTEVDSGQVLLLNLPKITAEVVRRISTVRDAYAKLDVPNTATNQAATNQVTVGNNLN
jgi:purine-binding chemotaxis protein CheW